MAIKELVDLIRRSSRTFPLVDPREKSRIPIPLYKLICPSDLIDNATGKRVACGDLAGPTADIAELDRIARDHISVTAAERYKKGKLVHSVSHAPTVFFVGFED